MTKSSKEPIEKFLHTLPVKKRNTGLNTGDYRPNQPAAMASIPNKRALHLLFSDQKISLQIV
jgi:hypothetical protein